MEKSYQVIARRWRPGQFTELVGQDHIVRTLSNAIKTGRIAHAYLFVGPRGTGKTSTARLFAKALNASGGPSIIPDNDSAVSRAIMDGSCMDVIEIDGASNNNVDQVRRLREECQFAPFECTYKIYIIDEVHMLSDAAFNALLKILEEPPRHVKFLFATTEAHKVLPTIVSRCQRFEFRPIPDAVIAAKLGHICKEEGIQVEAQALASIARLANGGMRDAQSILDQMISFCGGEIKETDVLDVYGLISVERIGRLASALAAVDFAAIISWVDELSAEGRNLFRILLDLEAFLRETLIDAIQNNGVTRRLGVKMTNESIMRMLDALHRGESSVQRGLSEKVNFEVVLLKAAEESRLRAIDSLIKEMTAATGSSSGSKKKLAVPNVRESSRPIAKSALRSEASPKEVSRDSEESSIEAPEPVEVTEERGSDELVLQESTADVGFTRSSLTIEEAKTRLGPEILRVLSEELQGELTEVRSPDPKDQIFR